MLRKRKNPKSGKTEWCLVSKKDPSRVLRWYGTKKPSPEKVAEDERQIAYFESRD